MSLEKKLKSEKSKSSLIKKISTLLLTGVLTCSYGINSVSAQEPTKTSNKVNHQTKKQYDKTIPNGYNDFKKTSLTEATLYTSAAGIVVLSFIPEWRAIAKTPPKKLCERVKWGFTHAPVWDSNPWQVNYVGHPIFGAESYMLARNRGHSMLNSFLYSTATSVTWEYFVESLIGAKPSKQDLIITSPVGSVLGELRYRAKKKLIENRHKSKHKKLNKIGIVVLDPLDAIFRIFEKL